jgi:hypothetical protein
MVILITDGEEVTGAVITTAIGMDTGTDIMVTRLCTRVIQATPIIPITVIATRFITGQEAEAVVTVAEEPVVRTFPVEQEQVAFQQTTGQHPKTV